MICAFINNILYNKYICHYIKLYILYGSIYTAMLLLYFHRKQLTAKKV